MLEIPVLKAVNANYSGERNHPLFFWISDFLSRNGDSQLPTGWVEDYQLYMLFQQDPQHFEKFKGLHCEFDTHIAFFEFLSKIQLRQEAVQGQRSELFRFIKWSDDEDVSLNRLVQLFAVMEHSEILNSANVMLLTKTRVWTVKNEHQATKTPVWFTFVDEIIKRDVQSVAQWEAAEEKCELMQKNYNNLFQAGRYSPDFRF